MAGKRSGTCIVADCLSAYYPGCRTRFHLFPKDEKKRNKWLKCLKLKPRDYTVGAKLCYLHFDKTDYVSNNPEKPLKSHALPSAAHRQYYENSGESDVDSVEIEKALEKLDEVSTPNDSSDNEDYIVKPSSDDTDELLEPVTKKKRNTTTKYKKRKAVKIENSDDEDETYLEGYEAVNAEIVEDVYTHVCRTCLTTGCKMYSIPKYNLEQTYLLLTGINSDMFEESKMPQMLCFECVRRLQNFIEFSTRSLTAWSLLMELIEEDKLTIDSIKSLDREQNLLSSKLSIQHYEPNYFDIQVEEYENEIPDLIGTPIEIAETNDDNTYLEIKDILDDFSETKEDKNVSEEVQNSDDNVDESKSDDEIDYNVNSRKKWLNKKYVKEFNELFVVKTMTPEEQRADIEKRKDSKLYIYAKYKCDQCYRGFQIEEPYLQHMRRHTDEFGTFVCDFCKTHFETRGALDRHIRARHHVYIRCRRCPFASAWKNAAAAHKNYHDGHQYVCPHCPRRFTKSTTHRTHLQRWHPEDVVCHLCGESFTGIRGIENHLRYTHRGVDHHFPPSKKKFAPIRRKETMTKYTIVTYETALPETAPSCNKCDIRFVDSTALQRHWAVSPLHGNPPKTPYKIVTRPSLAALKSKKPSGPVVCEQCGEEFPTLREYSRHFRAQHPGCTRTQYSDRLATFMCDMCGKIFQNISTMKDHRQAHSGLRPYKCEKCGKNFTTRMTLSTHKADHTQSRKCKVCGNEFASVAGLKRHILLHTGLKPYKCEPCNKSFCSPSARETHIRHSHLGVPWPKRRDKTQPKLRVKGGTFQSEADMDPSAQENTMDAQELEE